MIDLLIAPCGQLLTLATDGSGPRRAAALRDLGLLTDGAVGIDRGSGMILYAGPLASLDRSLLSLKLETIEAANQVVLPGFVDSHTHLVFAGSRADEFYRRAAGESYQEISLSGGGIARTVKATNAASEDELLRPARDRVRQLWANGTTTVEIKSGYGLNPDAELKQLRVASHLRNEGPGLVFRTLMAAHAVPAEYRDNRDGYIEVVCELTRHAAAAGLAEYHDVFVDPLAFSHAEAERIVAAGNAAGLPLKLHADEFGDDGSAAWGVAQGAVSIDHLGSVGEAGIRALANSDCIATLLPATMFFCGTGQFAPARRMIAAGCAVALASDLNPGSSLVYSMPFVMTLAALHMGMSAEECITAATINAAHALRAADRIGSLEAGKRADVVVLNVPHYNELAYHVGADIVRDVVIGGQQVKRDGALLLQ